MKGVYYKTITAKMVKLFLKKISPNSEITSCKTLHDVLY
jgi:hypothetical protein